MSALRTAALAVIAAHEGKGSIEQSIEGLRVALDAADDVETLKQLKDGYRAMWQLACDERDALKRATK
jgi:hypothetical protein